MLEPEVERSRLGATLPGVRHSSSSRRYLELSASRYLQSAAE